MPVWVEALIGVGTFLLGGLVTSVWSFSRINNDVERMKEDIGTTSEGMRYQVLKSSIELTTLQAKFESAVDRLDGLHDWKHEVGEAYLPRAVDEHERRLNRIEAKVFNGHH